MEKFHDAFFSKGEHSPHGIMGVVAILAIPAAGAFASLLDLVTGVLKGAAQRGYEGIVEEIAVRLAFRPELFVVLLFTFVILFGIFLFQVFIEFLDFGIDHFLLERIPDEFLGIAGQIAQFGDVLGVSHASGHAARIASFSALGEMIPAPILGFARAVISHGVQARDVRGV
ncbi:MAG: hypothetical protein M1457_01300 [bacterium]|nr:hypothetical protein [bacterium]